MFYLILLAAITLIPVLLVILSRANGAITFMGLCLGSVLVAYTSSDVTGVLTSFSAAKNLSNVTQWSQLALLGIPLLLALLFTRHSVKGVKSLLNIFPALATGLLGLLFVVPLLPAGLQQHVHQQVAWKQISDAQTGILLGGALFSFVLLLLTHYRGHAEGESGRRHERR